MKSYLQPRQATRRLSWACDVSTSVIRSDGCSASCTIRDVRYRTELTSFRQDNAGVVATIKGLNSGTSHVVHSTSGFDKLPIFFVIIYFRGPWPQFVPELGEGDALQITSADAPGIFMTAKDDLALFAHNYFPNRGEGAERFTADWCRALVLKAIGAPIDVEIIDTAPWQPYE